MMLVGGIISGLIGLGMGYLTLRLRGTFFSIATLAMAVVAQTLITNWNFVGGSRGAYIIRPAKSPLLRRRLHPIPVPGDAGCCAVLAVVHRAGDRAFPPRLRLRHDPR